MKRLSVAGFTLMELLLALIVITAMTAATWVYMRPADHQSKVAAFVMDLDALRDRIKDRGVAATNTVLPYTSMSTSTLYGWGIVPASMSNADVNRMDSPWGTRVLVSYWSLVNAAGTALDVGQGAGFNLRIEMPDSLADRQAMCAPLVTLLAPIFPQMSYTAIGSIGQQPPGTIVISGDLPATASRMPTIVSTVCGQVSQFVLVVADA